MTKIKLNDQGAMFHRAFRACMNWMGIGGDITTESGHRLAMTEDGLPGFVVTWNTYPAEERMMQIGSDTAWMFLVDHAKMMNEREIIIMQANTALNKI